MKIHLRKQYEAYVRKSRRVTTVRHMFPLIALALGILGASSFSANGTSYVTLKPIPSYVKAGGTVSISVDAVAATAVNAIDIQIAYPTDTLKIKQIDTGESVITLWTEEPKVEGNKVILRGGVYRKGFIGEHHIATIVAEALKDGSAEILVKDSTFLAGDGTGASVRVTKNDADRAVVTVGEGTQVANSGKGEGGKLSANVAVEIVTDIDGNGTVDFGDIQAFMSAWRNGNKTFDFNSDGRMTFRDFAIILSDSFWK